MKIVVVSDIHGRFNRVTIPECDLLISCGDYSFRGDQHEVRDFHKWLNKQNARHIISCQGNHELGVERDFNLSKQLAVTECPRVHFVEEGLIEIEGVRIWCSAITPWFCDWAWNRFRGKEIKEHWDLIPNDIDILVTHGPPAGILDLCPSGDKVGCQDLWEKILQIPTLKHHFFGHIHHSYGHYEFNGVHYWNVAICDERYQPVNAPVVIDF